MEMATRKGNSRQAVLRQVKEGVMMDDQKYDSLIIVIRDAAEKQCAGGTPRTRLDGFAQFHAVRDTSNLRMKPYAVHRQNIGRTKKNSNITTSKLNDLR